MCMNEVVKARNEKSVYHMAYVSHVDYRNWKIENKHLSIHPQDTPFANSTFSNLTLPKQKIIKLLQPGAAKSLPLHDTQKEY